MPFRVASIIYMHSAYRIAQAIAFVKYFGRGEKSPLTPHAWYAILSTQRPLVMPQPAIGKGKQKSSVVFDKK
jgi:hypothetical protein